MSQSDSGQSLSDLPPTEFPYFRAVPPAHDPETVINTDRRIAAQPIVGAAPMSGSSVSQPTSSVWNRLFPYNSEVGEDYEIQSPAGMALGHFEIEERIGSGGMGAVFRTLDTRLQRIVALKVLSPTQSRDPSSVERFRNEARAAARLDHDNIARVFYIGEDLGLHFIAFEFVTGTNVRELIRERGQLDPEDAVNYVLQIASALNHTSAAGVVHRDIKPSNIIITPTGRAKLVDLGLARKATTESAEELTLAGTTLGTFDYISPEQAKDPRNVDVRSDIYSLGCTLYHMLTGEPPYPEGTVLQKLLDHQGKEPPDPARKNRRVSEDLSAIVRKMMASDPKRRYANPDQLIHDLMLIAGTLGLRGVNPEGLVWMSSKPPKAGFWERHLYWIATAATLLLIVGALERFGANLQQFSQPRQENARSVTPRTGTNAARLAGDTHTTDGDLAERLPNTPSDGRVPPPIEIAEETDSATDVETGRRPDSRVARGGSDPLPLPETMSAAGASLPGQGKEPNPLAPKFGSPFIFDNPELTFLTTKPALPATMLPETTSNNTDRTPKPQGRPKNPPLPPAIETVADAPPAKTPETNGERTPYVKPTGRATEDLSPIVVISVDGTQSKTYRTLEAACSAAEDGSVIELRYDGVRREVPVRITNKKNLTIRGARGFQPTIEFIPAEIPGEGFQTRMITVTKGILGLINVNLRLTVREDFDEDQLVLFSLERPEQIRLQRVAITVENPNPTLYATAIAELVSEPGQTLVDMQMMPNNSPSEPAEFEIIDCFLRGGCDLILVKDTKPVDFTIRNSVLALDGAMLNVVGSRETPEENARLSLKIDHVTCVLGGNLIHMDSGVLPRRLLPVHVSSRNNVFASSTNSSLVAMQGHTDDADFRTLLLWSGEKNFYDQYRSFWSLPSTPEGSDFERWKRDWEPTVVGASNARISWKELWNVLNFAEILPSDLSLDRTVSDNPPLAGATDGTNAGADLLQLPVATERLVRER